MSNKRSEILLETGTNELEIVVFCVGKEYYGINVAKVREIIRSDVTIVPIPDGHRSINGVINLRGKIIPVVNLAHHLGMKVSYDRKSRIIVTEFNQIHSGFLVTEVSRIYRLSWKEVESPSGLINSKQGYAVGVVKIEDKVIFLLDFERIASVINPESGLEGVVANNRPLKQVNFDRGTKKILVAEDSPFILQMLTEYLKKGGYKFEAFKDGLEAWTYIEKTLGSVGFEKVQDYFHLLITDIEMPQMDGLHLIKRVKEQTSLKNFPCIVFSSMISAELSLKCQRLGAIDQITKPEIDRLVALVDQHVL